jgi:hypothetical protein
MIFLCYFKNIHIQTRQRKSVRQIHAASGARNLEHRPKQANWRFGAQIPLDLDVHVIGQVLV